MGAARSIPPAGRTCQPRSGRPRQTAASLCGRSGLPMDLSTQPRRRGLPRRGATLPRRAPDGGPARGRRARPAGVFAEFAAGARWHKVLAKKGWSAPRWPREYGGTGWIGDAALHLLARVRGGRRAAHLLHGAAHGRARHHEVRHAGAEGEVPAAHRLGRHRLLPGLLRAGLRLRSRQPQVPRGAATATTT